MAGGQDPTAGSRRHPAVESGRGPRRNRDVRIHGLLIPASAGERRSEWLRSGGSDTPPPPYADPHPPPEREVARAADHDRVIDTKEASRTNPGPIARVIDRAIELVGALSSTQSLVLAGLVYLGWGIALPVLTGTGTLALIMCTTEGTVFAAAILFAQAIPYVDRRLRHQQLQLTTNLRHLSAREFESIVGTLFEHEGWHVTQTGGHGTPDGNIDLVLRRDDERRLVQCKRWTSRDIGVDEIRKLGGTLMREGRRGGEGILVTSAGFYPPAVDEAAQLGIELIDGDELVRRLEAAGATGLLDRRVRAGWQCPTCDSAMLLGKSPHGWWLRCSQPGCTGKHDLGKDDRLALEKILAGA